MSKPSRNRIHFSRNPKKTDLIAFVAFFLMGVFLEILLHFAHAPLLMVAVAPVLCLAGYASLTFFKRFFTLRLDQIGDNCYYLGFLYTLTALSLALYSFSTSNDSSAAGIVSSFGIALASTIAGVFLRVLFSQMREDPAEIEAESRVELARASQELKAQLTVVVRDLNMFTDGVQQSLLEAFEEHNNASQTSIATASQALTKLADEVATTSDKQTKLFDERLSLFNSLSSRSLTALEQLVENLEQLESPKQSLEKILEPAVSAMAQMSNKFMEMQKSTSESFARSTASINEFETSATKLAGGLASISDGASSLDRFAKSVTSVEDVAPKLRNKIEALTGMLEKFSSENETALAKYNTALQSSSDEFSKQNIKVREQIEDNIALTGKVRDHLAEMAQGLAEAVRQ